MSYSNCLSVRVGSEGFALALWVPFRTFHPNLFIPWHAVVRCTPEKFWFVNCTAVYLSKPATRLLFRGRTARAMLAQWGTLHA